MSCGLGLDIGGANIKYFLTGTNQAGSIPFPLFATPGELSRLLHDTFVDQSPLDWVALTMTGELCDCFASRAEGVEHIVQSAQVAFADSRIFVYKLPHAERATSSPEDRPTTNNTPFVSPEEVNRHWQQIAAANWHATGSWLASKLSLTSPALMVDLGSTTTDLIPIWDQRVQAYGRTDFERLGKSELLYLGMSRTPLQGVLPAYEYSAGTLRLANEWFCSPSDAYLLIGEIVENPLDCRTADRRPLTKANSQRRIARAICAEPEEVGEELLIDLARQACTNHRALLRIAIQKISDRILEHNLGSSLGLQYIACGEGEWLVRQVIRELALDAPITSVSERFADDTSQALPAVAVASLFQTMNEF